MAQNITLMNAQYPDVPAVTLPKTGGGTAVFTDTSDANATAGDIASGKTAYVNGIKITGTGSGGGASNVVTGTFTGTTEGASMDVNIPYTGSGYPIFGVIFPSGGAWIDQSTIRTAVHYRAMVFASFVKDDFSLTPDYGNFADKNCGEMMIEFKNSESDATIVANNFKHEKNIYYDYNASAYTDTVFRIRGNKKLAVYISSTSYGFLKDVEYTYQITYSS